MDPDRVGERQANDGGFHYQQSVAIDDHNRQPYHEMHLLFDQAISQQRQQTSASPSHGLLEPNTVGPFPPRHTSRVSFRQHREDTASVQVQERRPGMQQEESCVNLSSRYPKQLLELCRADVSVEHLQEGPLFNLQSGYRQPRQRAYNMPTQGDEQASRGLGLFEVGPLLAGPVYCREGQTASSESTEQVRFSVEETNQFPDKSQPVEHMDTHSLPRRLTSNRLCCARGGKLSPGRIFDGNFIIWRIENFSIHLRDAVNGGISSLEGPPIYTGLYGYKLRICMFPTGIDGGDRRHAGLFIGMMQGEYDNILEWPFTAIISLTMLDQSNGEDPHHISGTFVTDRNQRAFQKPDTTVQYDTLYGYAEFAPIDMICNPRYSRDDTVMIKIEIHPYSIP